MAKKSAYAQAVKDKADRALRRKCDRLAVNIVSRIDAYNPHKLMAYDGIQAAREIRELLIQKFS